METKNSLKPTNCKNFSSTKMQCILLGKEYNDTFKTKPKIYKKKKKKNTLFLDFHLKPITAEIKACVC